MEYRWIEDIEEFKDIVTGWDNALIASGNYNPFLLSDFIILWWKYFSDGLPLRIFILFHGGKIVAGLPLYLGRRSLGNMFIRSLCYIGDSAANYTEPLYASDQIELLPLLRDALLKRNDWDVLNLTDIREGNRLISECGKASLDKRLNIRIINDHQNWGINLSEGIESYYSWLSKKLRKDLRAKRKRAVKELGQIKLSMLKSEKEVERYFDLYAEFSQKTFKKRSRNSNFENFKYSAFFKEFLIAMFRKERLDAHVLLAEAKILAISFAYKFGKGFNWALTGFNYNYRYFRPGYLLIEELLKECAGRKETFYNWYGHERFYKMQWCNAQAPLFRLFISRRTLRGAFYSSLNSIENSLRANRAVVAFFRKIKRS